MQGKLIESVLAQTQTPPQQKKEVSVEAIGITASVFVVLFLGIAILIRQRKATIDLSDLSPEEYSQAIKIAKEYASENAEASSQILESAAGEINAMNEEIERKKQNEIALKKKIANQWAEHNIEKIKAHKYTIYQIHTDSVDEDAYVNISYDRWMQVSDYAGVAIGDVKDNAFMDQKGFTAGFPYFWKNVLVDKSDYRADAWFDGWWKYKIDRLGIDTVKKIGISLFRSGFMSMPFFL